ncbi:MAG: hypothetical protein OEX19_06445 [Gammaproteobacteria bacterium]|nr:hypothetical protein [Gammaproteobacteria bacterium]
MKTPVTNYISVLATLSFFILPNTVMANTGSAKILSPSDGATLYIDKNNTVDYQVELGKKGNHLHVWVDGEKGPAQRSLKGSYTLPKLSPGKHAIILKVVDKGHVPTGPVQAIFVNAEE